MSTTANTADAPSLSTILQESGDDDSSLDEFDLEAKALNVVSEYGCTALFFVSTSEKDSDRACRNQVRLPEDACIRAIQHFAYN